LTRKERAAMAAIIAFAGASHMATLGVLAGLSVVYAAAWVFRRRLGITLQMPGMANAAAWSAIALVLLVNFLVAGRLSLTPGGDLILFGRLIETGIVGKVL